MDKDVAGLIKEAVTEVLEELRNVPPPPPTQGHQVVTHHYSNAPPTPPPPTPSWHIWVCVGLLAAATMLSGFTLYMVGEANDNARADRVEFNRKLDSLEGSDNAIRAYINTGILKPREEAKK
jgi:hypothetical protein